MSVRPVTSDSQSYGEQVQNTIQTKGRYSSWRPAIAACINTLAIPILALLAMASLPQADAGPVAYAACVSGCEMAFTQAALWGAAPTGGWSFLAVLGSGPFCAAICAPALAAPSP